MTLSHSHSILLYLSLPLHPPLTHWLNHTHPLSHYHNIPSPSGSYCLCHSSVWDDFRSSAGCVMRCTDFYVTGNSWLLILLSLYFYSVGNTLLLHYRCLTLLSLLPTFSFTIHSFSYLYFLVQYRTMQPSLKLQFLLPLSFFSFKIFYFLFFL